MSNLIEEVKRDDSARFMIDKSGALYGVSPAETMFGYLYFSHMVPPIRPEHTLILGYGHGTVAELMRKIWGQCKVTGVDLMGYQTQDAYLEYKLEVMDAKEYVWQATRGIFKKRFDYICIDLWNGKEVPNFVFEVEFVVRLCEMAKKYVCLNVTEADISRMRAYYDYGFQFDRVVPVEGNRVMWWSVPDET